MAAVVDWLTSGMSRQPELARRVPPYALPVLILLLAVAVRFTGIDWHGAHPDEHPSAAAKVLTGQLTDDLQYYPPLLNYVTAVLYAGYFAAGKAFGLWGSTGEFRAAFFTDRMPFFVLLRSVTAFWAALAAPLVYFLALRLGQKPWTAALAGVATAIIPASVYFSHIGKSDNGLASAFLLACLLALRLIDEPRSLSRQVALGAAIAFAFSVKHSALFLLGPAALMVVAALVRHGVRVGDLARLGAVTAAAAVVFWVPMNIGIVLDPHGFIAAQIVQSQMSSRDADWLTTLRLFYEVVTSEGGLPAAVVIAWLLVPGAILALPDRSARFCLWLLWIPTALSIVVIGSIAGDRQPFYLWLPQMTLMGATVALVLTLALSSARRALRLSAGVLIAALVGAFTLQSAAVLDQATAKPILLEVADEIKRSVDPSEKILTTNALTPFLDTSSAGRDIDRARHERLAAKYKVELPPVAAESLVQKDTGYTVASFPLVIGGLERTDPEKVKVVLPYAWPLQPEEWRLDYWLERGFRVLVVSKESELAEVPAYRAMFSAIRSQCRPIGDFKSRRPLFNDFDTLIYRC